MDKIRICVSAVRRKVRLGCVAFLLLGVMGTPAFGLDQVGLYDVWETQVTNSNSYSNPFDYNVIELQATFTSPNGQKMNFFGFYDGDGNGGQNGNVWKLRFMPDKVGTWNYAYSWTDGTPGGSGTFTVVDTGLTGPLKVATDNPWYFMTARGEPFDWRGYKISGVAWFADDPITTSVTNFKNVVNDKMVGKYNVTMIVGPGYSQWAEDYNNTNEQWWPYNSSSFDFTRYNVKIWKSWDDLMRFYASKQIYTFPFALVSQNSGKAMGVDGMKRFYRYFAARNAAYWHFFGWSATWEWHDIWGPSQVDEIMQFVDELGPGKSLLSSHDCSHQSFDSWLSFSMRQSHSRDVFDGNSRTAFWTQIQDRKTMCGQSGIAPAFVDIPIVGSEDTWEMVCGATKTQPCNATQVRRGAWGGIMAGILPLYSEWGSPAPANGSGNGDGEPDIRRMYDFFYSNTKYRQYQQLNQLVSSSARQIASGIPAKEYLVYDENGGSITINLAGAPSSRVFSVLWYDPKSGTEKDSGQVNGGASRSLSSPFSGDSVLLLKELPLDTDAPEQPVGLKLST